MQNIQDSKAIFLRPFFRQFNGIYGELSMFIKHHTESLRLEKSTIQTENWNVLVNLKISINLWMKFGFALPFLFRTSSWVWTNSTHQQLCIQEVMQLQLLVHLQPVLIHLLLLFLGKVIILLLHRVTFLHLVPAQPLAHLGLVQTPWNHLTEHSLESLYWAFLSPDSICFITSSQINQAIWFFNYSFGKYIENHYDSTQTARPWWATRALFHLGVKRSSNSTFCKSAMACLSFLAWS